MAVPNNDLGPGHGALVRVGGVAVILGLAIHIVLNSVLKEFPPENPTATELQEYLTREAGTWAVVHGFRYLAFACVVLFATGLFSRVSQAGAAAGGGWGVVGLLGTAMWVTNGVITNGIETVAFLNLDLVSQRQELFWLLFRLTRVLFTAEIAAWSITILGFSVAGWRSGTIPKWLAMLGLLAAVLGMLSSIFIVPILNEGRASILMGLAAPMSMLWLLCTGVYMALRGATGVPASQRSGPENG